MSNYQSKISQKATYLRVYEGGRMLYGEEVTKVIHNLEKRIIDLEKALDKIIDRAQQVDGWESFPESWIDQAYEALKEPTL
jgi:hypothetical protein